MDLIVQYGLDNEQHTFVDVLAYYTWDLFQDHCVLTLITKKAWVGWNVDKGVLICHTVVYGKIHLKS